MLPILAAPRLDGGLARDAMLDHDLAHGHAVLQAILHGRKLELIGIHPMARTGVEHCGPTANRVGARPLTCGRIGYPQLRGKGAMTCTLRKRGDRLTAHLSTVHSSCFFDPPRGSPLESLVSVTLIGISGISDSCQYRLPSYVSPLKKQVYVEAHRESTSVSLWTYVTSKRTVRRPSRTPLPTFYAEQDSHSSTSSDLLRT